MKEKLPTFPYHRAPGASGSFRESRDPCGCCGEARGVLYDGVTYAIDAPENICPWCIADGTAAARYDAEFFDAEFVDEQGAPVSLSKETRRNVFGRTIGFATFNPIGWWVHCGEPAEYVERDEPYDMIFECRLCKKQHRIEDFD